MTRNEKMIGTRASVPKRVPTGDECDVVLNDVLKAVTRVICVRTVHKADYIDNANRKEEGNGLVRVASQEWAVTTTVEFVNQLSLHGVDVVHRTDVKERRLSFLVWPYTEPFFHLNVTPEQ